MDILHSHMWLWEFEILFVTQGLRKSLSQCWMFTDCYSVTKHRFSVENYPDWYILLSQTRTEPDIQIAQAQTWVKPLLFWTFPGLNQHIMLDQTWHGPKSQCTFTIWGISPYMFVTTNSNVGNNLWWCFRWQHRSSLWDRVSQPPGVEGAGWFSVCRGQRESRREQPPSR